MHAIRSRAFTCLQYTALLLAIFMTGCGSSGGSVPSAIRTIMRKPRYSQATWALRVVDVKSGAVIYDLNSQEPLLTGSVRKLYSVGVTLNKLGPDYRFTTPVYRTGQLDGSGNLSGNLILLAKGDLTMGGRDNGDDTIAITDFDHNDANNLGGAILTAQILSPGSINWPRRSAPPGSPAYPAMSSSTIVCSRSSGFPTST